MRGAPTSHLTPEARSCAAARMQPRHARSLLFLGTLPQYN